MAYEVKTEEQNGITIIRLEGEMVLGAATNAFRAALRGALQAGGPKKVLVDLGDVKFLDSTGIGEIVAGYTLAWEGAGQVKLCKLPQKIKDVLVVTRLSTVFEIHETEEEAIAAFA
jgi:anti-sigma B factor antagonist